MKVSYITLHYVSNYGSVLQTYATQEIFKKIGMEPECVAYVRENSSGSLKRAVNCYNEVFQNRSAFHKAAYCVYYILGDIKRKRIFSSFIKKNIKMSRRYSSYEQLLSDAPEADIYCTGSDQTWNSVYNGGVEQAYFLQYAPPEKPKIALAASFGTESVNADEYSEIKELIHQYQSISVRELSAKRILDEMDYPSAEVILDPTLLIEKSRWKKLFGKSKYADKKYLLVFALNKNDMLNAAAVKISEQLGVPIVRVSFSMKDIFKSDCIYLPSVGEFLSLIDNAGYILTDSFHGTAFSLNFGKQVFAVFPERYTTRLKSILQVTGCMHRVISSPDVDVSAMQPIDYARVNRILNEKRRDGYEFIKKACKM